MRVTLSEQYDHLEEWEVPEAKVGQVDTAHGQRLGNSIVLQSLRDCTAQD